MADMGIRMIDKRSIFWRDKCLNCGCQNKLMTTIYDCKCGKKKEVGYTLSCCHCGVTRTFVTDDKYRGREHLFDKLIHDAKGAKCIMRERCPRVGCKFHPKYKENKNKCCYTHCNNCNDCKKCCNRPIEIDITPTREFL